MQLWSRCDPSAANFQKLLNFRGQFFSFVQDSLPCLDPNTITMTIARSITRVVVQLPILLLATQLSISCKDKISDYNEARKIITSDALEPDSLLPGIQAFMLKHPLEKGDRIAPLGYPEKTKIIERTTWFCWADRDPDADFGHPTNFIFLEARNGKLIIEAQTWSPVLNDTLVLWRNSADPGYDSAIIFSYFK